MRNPRSYFELLLEHIEKENELLYPGADGIIPGKTLPVMSPMLDDRVIFDARRNYPQLRNRKV